ncbi:hypothetical protein VNO77_23754 [Canavalia gladiata]|uniref:3'-5' exonuclease domain-containing protein n=1 Tax=Canavalia gladiata TaxID=3824 RepID=A0AAN9QC44_CANGL
MVIAFRPECCNPGSNRHLYRVSLHGDIFSVTITATVAVARRWLYLTRHLNRAILSRGALVVGLGVQWTNSTDGNPVADTVNLCVGDRCLIFQISRAGSVPLSLRRFLVDPRCTFVGFWNRHDRNMLLASRHTLDMANDPLDLRMILNNRELADSDVETIVEACLGYRGVRLVREVNISDWSVGTLHYNQVLQASLEAHCAFLIGCQFQAWEYR